MNRLLSHDERETLVTVMTESWSQPVPDGEVIVCYGGAKLTDEHLVSTIHCFSSERSVLRRLNGPNWHPPPIIGTKRIDCLSEVAPKNIFLLLVEYFKGALLQSISVFNNKGGVGKTTLTFIWPTR